MTAEEMKRLRELAEKATPGPWDCDDADESRGGYNAHAGWFSVSKARTEDMVLTNQPEMGMFDRRADAAFVVAANPQTVLALLDEIERLRASHALRDEGYANADYQAVAENIAHDPRWAVRADSQRVARWALHLTEQLAAVSAARDEACRAWQSLVQVTSQHPDYTRDPEYVRAGELLKVGAP
jgi:hypothetical protein